MVISTSRGNRKEKEEEECGFKCIFKYYFNEKSETYMCLYIYVLYMLTYICVLCMLTSILSCSVYISIY